MILIIFFTIIIASLSLYVWRKATYWTNLGVPNVGFFTQFYIYCGWSTAGDLDLALSQKYGKIYGTYEFLTPILVIADLNTIRQIQMTDFVKFRNRSTFPSSGARSLDLNVFFLHDEHWRRKRPILSSVFTLSKLRSMSVQCIIPSINNFMTNLSCASENGSKSLSMRKYFNCITMDVIVSCIYGVKIDCLKDPNNEIIRQASQIFRAAADLFSSFGSLRGVDTSSLDYLCKLTMELVEKRHVENMETRIRRADFLQTMVDAKYNDDDQRQGLRDDDICSFAITFWGAGYDTTSTTMTALAYYLATNPKVQDKLSAEVQSLDVSSAESVAELQYLDAAVKETLRLWPPVFFNDRCASIDYQLEDEKVTIPAGVTIHIPLYALHRNPKYFKNPSSFIPERFIESSEVYEKGTDPITLQAFGLGPRACPGQKFSTLQIKLTFAKLLQRFKFVATRDTKLEAETGQNFVVFTKDVWLQVLER